MTERRFKAGLKAWHRWLGVAAALFLMASALTGFLLQHPEWLTDGEVRVGALAADPAREGRLLRGVAWGVEESRDDGATWRELPILAPPTNVFRIHFDPADSERVFALGPWSAVTSADGGRIWEELAWPADLVPEGTELRDVTAAPGGPWSILTDAGVLRTFDRGATWDLVAAADRGETDWVRWMHDLHTGRMFGSIGARITETGALVLIFLVISGLFLALRRGRRRSR